MTAFLVRLKSLLPKACDMEAVVVKSCCVLGGELQQPTQPAPPSFRRPPVRSLQVSANVAFHFSYSNCQLIARPTAEPYLLPEPRTLVTIHKVRIVAVRGWYWGEHKRRRNSGRDLRNPRINLPCTICSARKATQASQQSSLETRGSEQL